MTTEASGQRWLFGHGTEMSTASYNWLWMARQPVKDPLFWIRFHATLVTPQESSKIYMGNVRLSVRGFHIDKISCIFALACWPQGNKLSCLIRMYVLFKERSRLCELGQFSRKTQLYIQYFSCIRIGRSACLRSNIEERQCTGSFETKLPLSI